MPIKRIEPLKNLSREHHHGLLLCWKIRQGLKLNIETERIKTYVGWFWDHHLQLHFEKEEKFLFPVIGNQHELIQEGLAQHALLRKLFENKKKNRNSLTIIAQELEKHIRFEERVLFNEIQKVITVQELDQLRIADKVDYCDNLTDEFWVK